MLTTPTRKHTSRSPVGVLVCAGLLVVAPVASWGQPLGLPGRVRAAAQAEAAGQLPVAGEQVEVEWPPEVVQTLRTFFERTDVEDVMEGVQLPRAASAEADVRSLTATFDGRWEAPFEFVSRRIGYVPYAGSVRGPRGTLLSGSGNALDQSLLLMEMYRARGDDTRLVRGRLGWDDAARLIGGAPERSVVRGDPWIRWIETAADHWWVEVRRGADWVALDPSFLEAEVGRAYARSEGVASEAPVGLIARVAVEVRDGARSLTRIEATAAELLWEPIVLRARVPPAEAEPGAPMPGVRSGPSQPSPAESDREVATGDDVGGQDEERDVLADLLPPAADREVTLILSAAGRVVETSAVQLSALSSVNLHVRASLPLAPAAEIRLAWGSVGTRTRLAVLLGAGFVHRARLADSARPLYRSLQRLATAEIEALAAYRARPDPDDPAADEIDVDPPAVEAEVPPTDLVDDPEAEEGDEAAQSYHPAELLHREVVRAWLDFDEAMPAAVAFALLSAADRLSGPVGMHRTGLRTVGVRWAPPASAADGRLTVWLDDPVTLGGMPSSRATAIQDAQGLLLSALLGQALNRLTDGAPVTAFDVTLRTVGAGARLTWWPGMPGPGEWPADAAAAVQEMLRRGSVVVGPRAPLMLGEQPVLGWWVIPAGRGTTTGWVHTELGPAQSDSMLGDGYAARDLDAVLAALPSLHRAMRWLVIAADEDPAALADLVPRACAATSLVRDLLQAGAPSDWQVPAFGEFCLPVPARSTVQSDQPLGIGASAW